MPRLELTIDASGMPYFLPLLQKGVTLPARTGCSVRQFVCRQLGIADTYLDERVQTLFLNARPVDDVDRTLIENDACLALSAAMPGLLGATMRKDGRYAAFRKSISATAANRPPEAANGSVTLKLFNMVAREVGETLLDRGVGVMGSDLKRIVAQPEAWRHILAVRIDGQPADPEAAAMLIREDRPLQLTVRVSRTPP